MVQQVSPSAASSGVDFFAVQVLDDLALRMTSHIRHARTSARSSALRPLAAGLLAIQPRGGVDDLRRAPPLAHDQLVHRQWLAVATLGKRCLTCGRRAGSARRWLPGRRAGCWPASVEAASSNDLRGLVRLGAIRSGCSHFKVDGGAAVGLHVAGEFGGLGSGSGLQVHGWGPRWGGGLVGLGHTLQEAQQLGMLGGGQLDGLAGLAEVEAAVGVNGGGAEGGGDLHNHGAVGRCLLGDRRAGQGASDLTRASMPQPAPRGLSCGSWAASCWGTLTIFLGAGALGFRNLVAAHPTRGREVPSTQPQPCRQS